MLLPYNADKCPRCETEHSLFYRDDNKVECSISDFDANWHQIIKKEPLSDPSRYLSDETLTNIK